MIDLQILVVDDDPVIRRLLEQRLKKAGYDVAVAEDGHVAKDLITKRYYDLVLTDLVMPEGIGGIEVLEIAKKRNHTTEVMVITAHSSVDTAVQAMKKGAFDYLEKPINFDELFLRIDKISNMKRLVREAADLSLAMETTENVASTTIQDLEMQIQKIRDNLDSVENALREENTPDDMKIEKALNIIAES